MLALPTCAVRATSPSHNMRQDEAGWCAAYSFTAKKIDSLLTRNRVLDL